MNEPKPVTFTVALTVDPSWVREGFVLSDELAHSMLSRVVSGAYGHEIGARVISSSHTPRQLAAMQGYRGPKLKKAAAGIAKGMPTASTLSPSGLWRNVKQGPIRMNRLSDLLHPDYIPGSE